jgi:flagellar biosynthesis protein FlhF
MKIKRFRAKSFSEALELVKKELGDDAVVISTEEKKGLFPSVEVVAAVDYEDPAHGYLKARNQVFDGPQCKKGSKPISLSTEVPFTSPEIEHLLKEITLLKNTIEELKRSGYEFNLPPEKREAYNYLRERGIKEEFIFRLLEKTTKPEEIKKQISLDLKIKKPFFHRRALMLIGPTGTGKTTTIAKLAWHALKQGRRVGLINLDTYRIGAIEQIRIYAKIMGLPLHVVSDGKELQEALRDFSPSRDTVLIDTTGRRPSDIDYLKGLSEILRGLKEAGPFSIETSLLISANSEEDSMIEAWNYYRILPVTSLIFTKVDETVRFGHLYNLYLVYQKPVFCITTGQIVPDDIKFPSEIELASLILKKVMAASDGINIHGEAINV